MHPIISNRMRYQHARLWASHAVVSRAIGLPHRDLTSNITLSSAEKIGLAIKTPLYLLLGQACHFSESNINQNILSIHRLKNKIVSAAFTVGKFLLITSISLAGCSAGCLALSKYVDDYNSSRSLYTLGSFSFGMSLLSYAGGAICIGFADTFKGSHFIPLQAIELPIEPESPPIHMERELSVLDEAIETAERKIDGLEVSVSTLGKKIEAHGADIELLRLLIGSPIGTTNYIKPDSPDFALLDEAIETAERKIDGLEVSVSTLGKKIEAHGADIELLRLLIGSPIGTTNYIKPNSLDFALLDKQIEGINSKIAHLEYQLPELRLAFRIERLKKDLRNLATRIGHSKLPQKFIPHEGTIEGSPIFLTIFDSRKILAWGPFEVPANRIINCEESRAIIRTILIEYMANGKLVNYRMDRYGLDHLLEEFGASVYAELPLQEKKSITSKLHKHLMNIWGVNFRSDIRPNESPIREPYKRPSQYFWNVADEDRGIIESSNPLEILEHNGSIGGRCLTQKFRPFS